MKYGQKVLFREHVKKSSCFQSDSLHNKFILLCKTASLADEGNSAYCRSSGAHNIKHMIYKPMEINIERSPQH